MKERPILFSGSMIRALLAGTKTQTRRAIKRQPEPPRAIYTSHGADTKITPSLVRCENGMGVAWRFEMSKVASDKHSTLAVGYIDHEPVRTVCPYGNPGDRLWVRETWSHHVQAQSAARDEDGPFVYAADGPPALQSRLAAKWTPGIHMFRWASRILLEITDVRVERLQDISEADALAEGIVRQRDNGYGLADTTHYHSADPRMSYWSLWEAINRPGSVEANPWVWAVSFRPLSPGEHGRAAP